MGWLQVPKRVVAARRVVVAGVVALQVLLLARGLHSDHKEFAFRMFPESSTWSAEIVRVTRDGRRVPIDDEWPGGYRWSELVDSRWFSTPWVERHADAGVDNQLAFLRAALDWVAAHTPRDTETRHLEARVTYSRNTRPPHTFVFRSDER